MLFFLKIMDHMKCALVQLALGVGKLVNETVNVDKSVNEIMSVNEIVSTMDESVNERASECR